LEVSFVQVPVLAQALVLGMTRDGYWVIKRSQSADLIKRMATPQEADAEAHETLSFSPPPYSCFGGKTTFSY
jgi:hypothetical protein